MKWKNDADRSFDDATYFVLTLMRRRFGVADSTSSPETHVFPTNVISDIKLRRELLGGGANIPAEPLQCYCGQTYEYDHLAFTAWGTTWPNEECLAMAPIPRTAAQRWYQGQEDRAILAATDKAESEAADTALEALMKDREGWVQDDPNFWTFERSYNGVYPGDKKFPRLVDLGLEDLTIELVGATRVHIHACGIRDGCSRHLSRTETFQWENFDQQTFLQRLRSHEIHATSINLHEMSWCLVSDKCASIRLVDRLS